MSTQRKVDGFPIPAILLAHLAHVLRQHIPNSQQRADIAGHFSDLLTDEDGAALREMAE